MSTAPYRLPPHPGERIDRDKPIAFSFEGRTYEGLAGDTVASALAAHGVKILSRSFKYRRPRGVLTMAGQDANTLIQLGDAPNVPADTLAVAPGLEVAGQNYSGSLARDWGSWIGHFGRFLPVGFYYKAFFRPKGAWRFWEPVVRGRAGLGRVDVKAHHRYYDKAYAWHDVAVIGGGPAGMAAALEAARARADVLLVEENPYLGGSLAYARADAEGELALRRLTQLSGAVRSAGVRVMTGAMCQGVFGENWLSVIQGDRMYKVRAKEVVLATGSVEQPAVFRNNDLPGIMQGSAAQRLIRLYGVRPGKRAIVVTANSDGYGVALDLLDAGVEVAALLDLRAAPPSCARSEAARQRGVRVVPRYAPWEGVIGKDGTVAGLRIARIAGHGRCDAPDETIDCDLICMSIGYAPSAQLLHHAGGKAAYDKASATFTIRGVPPHMAVAGSMDGAYEIEAAIADGRRAGWDAVTRLGKTVDEPPMASKGGAGWNHPWPVFPHPEGKDFVDFDEDLQVSDIRNAIAEGYDHIELLKRYSTAGMGPSQGRHTALTLARLAAEATGRDIEIVGATTVRPPVSGEKFGHLAGRGFEPVRLTAMHHRHLELGAQMMPAGLWLRPAYYGAPDKRAEAIRAEAAAVREGVGIIDVSTLGGFDVRGPDAAELLNRLYTFNYKNQPVGRARYALMCDQTGAIIDDGVAARFHDQHFYVTATTGGADRVYQSMLWWNAQWRLDVDVTALTAAYAGVNIAGPHARAALAKLCKDVDLSPEAFPYMGVRTGTVAGISARLLRVGFVGELGYELHVPASQGEALWDALLYAGREFGIRPFGVEAQRLLRLEKGHIIVGQDTDGETHSYMADMGWAIAKKKPFFVGMRAIAAQMKRPLPRKLVGFALTNPLDPIPEECHLVVRDGAIVGRVTSAAYSDSLRRIIGLAFVAPDQAEPGSRFTIKIGEKKLIEAEVVKLPFYDPDGKRQEM
ncbi:MAG: glycine cleavage T C-terminal barrel domain-containing protein [Alphaproteobacteria bacterium]